MRAPVAILGLILLATPSVAQTIHPADARAHVGQTVTVEGVVSEVYNAARTNTTFIDMGGIYPNNVFTAVIFREDASVFPDVEALYGRTVDVTGAIRLYKGIPEIILNSADQLKRR
ncbi:MAG: nucleotide-binding protein [Rhizomicrobium sp.]